MALADDIPPSTNGDEKNVISQIAEHYDKIVLKGEGLTQAVVKEIAEFLIDCSDLTESIQASQITATLTGDKSDIPVRINSLGARAQIFRGVYTPLVAGKYNLKIFMNDELLPEANRTVFIYFKIILQIFRLMFKDLRICLI